MRRLLRALVAGGAAVLIAVGGSTASAGGWAVTMIDPFDEPEAGEDLQIGFTILQHGQTPVDVSGVTIIVDGPSGDQQRFPAELAEGGGRYRATIELAAAGRYHWQVIQGWFGPQDLGELDVSAGSAAASLPWGLAALAALAAMAALAGGAGIAGAMAWRRRRQPVPVRAKPQASWM